jgi:hypothetical protein
LRCKLKFQTFYIDVVLTGLLHVVSVWERHASIATCCSSPWHRSWHLLRLYSTSRSANPDLTTLCVASLCPIPV